MESVINTEYHANEHQMHSLNVIVGQKGGTIPSEVSNALAAYQTATAAGDTAAATKAFDDAVAANQKNGAAWSEVQAWHDEIKTQPHDTPLPGDPEQHRVYGSDLDILNYIVGNYGGPIPSEVSNALGAMQAATDPAEKQKQFDAAVAANQKNGAAWGAVQRWHDAIAKHAPIGDELPPPGGYPVGGAWPPTMPADGTIDWANVAPNTILWTQLTKDGPVSSAEGSGGRAVWGMVTDGGPATAIPFAGPAGTVASAVGQSGLIDAKAGQYFSSYFAPDGYGNPSKMRCSQT